MSLFNSIKYNISPESEKSKRERLSLSIPKNHEKVVDLAAYRRKRFTYTYNPEPETICTGDIEELIRQGRYWGTYTPAAPWGKPMRIRRMILDNDRGEIVDPGPFEAILLLRLCSALFLLEL